MSSSKSSTSGTPDPGEKVVLARLGSPKGLKGEIWLHLNTDRPRDVLGPGVHSLSNGRSVDVESLKDQNGRWLWKLKDMTREEAAQFVNCKVVADKGALPPRPDGEYDEADIIGLRVIDTSGADRGRIARIDHRYEIDTWIVELPDGRIGEIAAVDEFIQSVDIPGGTITVTPDSILEE